MFQNPFYSSPPKESTPQRPVKYVRETNQTKLEIVEVAKEVGIRKAAKIYKKTPSTVQSWIKQENALKTDIANKNGKGKEVLFNSKKQNNLDETWYESESDMDLMDDPLDQFSF